MEWLDRLRATLGKNPSPRPEAESPGDWLEGIRQSSQTLYPHIDFSRMSFDEIKAARAEALKPRPNEPDEKELLQWLKCRKPDDWHRCAMTWNWDQDFAPIRWIIRQAECDRGTAIQLFARGEPSYYAQYATFEQMQLEASIFSETYEFLMEVCKRWGAGQYKTYRFRPNELPHLKPGSLPWTAPNDLLQAKAQGQTLDTAGWNEGYPPQLITRGWSGA